MNTLLKFLVVMLLALSIVAFALQFMLFQQRELLKGRTQKLDQAVMKLATTIETEPAAVRTRPDYPARDIDKITAEPIDKPRRSDFWDHFPHECELTGMRTMDLSGRRAQLACYYQIDPGTLEIVRDPLTGAKLAEGPGTMQELLDELVMKSGQQLVRLNETRHHLQNCREELVSVVGELNTRKQELRLALNTVVSREQQIAGLQGDVRDRDRTIRQREDKIADLKDVITDRDTTIAQGKDTIQEQKDKIARLEYDLAAALGHGGQEPLTICRMLTHGNKGMVASVDSKWNFVLLKLSEDFVSQYVAARKKGADVSELDLTIMRNLGGEQTFVTKVQLCRVNPGNRVGVANLLNDWQQTEVREGDMVLY